MAFVNRIGNVLKNTLSKHAQLKVSASNPSLFQAIRSMSSSKLFVGGLSYNMDEMSLREAFSQCGEVVEVAIDGEVLIKPPSIYNLIVAARIIMDRETGRSRGFAFVTYTSTDEASSAIQELDGQELQGRRVRVNYATERTQGGGFGGGFGAGSGFNYGGNYGGSGGYQGGNFGGGGNYPRADENFGGVGGYGANNYPSGGSGFGGNRRYPSGDGEFGGSNNYPSGGGGYGSESSFSSPGYGGTPGTYSKDQEQGGNQSGTGAGINDFAVDLDANDREDNDEPNDYANTRR